MSASQAAFVSDNATIGGGLAATSDAQVNLNGSTFTSDAAIEGAGVYIENSTLFTNSATFTENNAVRTQLKSSSFNSESTTL